MTLTEFQNKYTVADFTQFDIPFTDYFYLKNHPNEENAQEIDTWIEKYYAGIAQKCNESGEYTIDCFKDRYTVRKIDEIAQIHYDAMTDEEKAEYDEKKRVEKIEAEISELKAYLSETDYAITKINEVMATGTDEELAEVKAEYAEVLTKRKEARARINELEKELTANEETEE
jgi:chromosome segregation ATPase